MTKMSNNEIEQLQAFFEPIMKAAAMLRAQGIVLTGVTVRSHSAHLHGAVCNTPTGPLRLSVEGAAREVSGEGKGK